MRSKADLASCLGPEPYRHAREKDLIEDVQYALMGSVSARMKFAELIRRMRKGGAVVRRLENAVANPMVDAPTKDLYRDILEELR